MGDLKNPRAIYFKGILFLLTGLIAAFMVWLRAPSFTTVLLLSIMIWSFCRAYYFVFYVIEHYVDPGYHFAGLTDFIRYLVGHPRKTTDNQKPNDDESQKYGTSA